MANKIDYQQNECIGINSGKDEKLKINSIVSVPALIFDPVLREQFLSSSKTKQKNRFKQGVPLLGFDNIIE